MSTLDAAADRRRHPRHAGDRRYLEVGGQGARLLDWSFTGIGAELDGGASGILSGAEVELRILRKDGVTWATLNAVVRRVDPETSTVGTELIGDNDQAMTLLLELLGHRLEETGQRN